MSHKKQTEYRTNLLLSFNQKNVTLIYPSLNIQKDGILNIVSLNGLIDSYYLYCKIERSNLFECIHFHIMDIGITFTDKSEILTITIK